LHLLYDFEIVIDKNKVKMKVSPKVVGYPDQKEELNKVIEIYGLN